MNPSPLQTMVAPTNMGHPSSLSLLQKIPPEVLEDVYLRLGHEDLLTMSRVDSRSRVLVTPKLTLKPLVLVPERWQFVAPELMALMDPRLNTPSGLRLMAFNWESCPHQPTISQLKNSCVTGLMRSRYPDVDVQRSRPERMSKFHWLEILRAPLSTQTLALIFSSGVKRHAQLFFESSKDFIQLGELFDMALDRGDTQLLSAYHRETNNRHLPHLFSALFCSKDPTESITAVIPEWKTNADYDPESFDFYGIYEAIRARAKNPISALTLLLSREQNRDLVDRYLNEIEVGGVRLESYIHNPAIDSSNFTEWMRLNFTGARAIDHLSFCLLRMPADQRFETKVWRKPVADTLINLLDTYVAQGT